MATDKQCMAMFAAFITMDAQMLTEFRTGTATVAFNKFNTMFKDFALSKQAMEDLMADRAGVKLFNIEGDIVQQTQTVKF